MRTRFELALYYSKDFTLTRLKLLLIERNIHETRFNRENISSGALVGSTSKQPGTHTYKIFTVKVQGPAENYQDPDSKLLH